MWSRLISGSACGWPASGWRPAASPRPPSLTRSPISRRGGSERRPDAIRLRRPGRPRLRLDLAVDLDRVDPLVVEADEVLDLRAFRNWVRVAPGDIAPHAVPELQIEMHGPALVRALGDGLGSPHEVHPDVQPRQVVARRQAGLEQETWA